MILNHHYEYHYAWSHSSNDLPVYYIISSFWEGQEGSFLLWQFWQPQRLWLELLCAALGSAPVAFDYQWLVF